MNGMTYLTIINENYQKPTLQRTILNAFLFRPAKDALTLAPEDQTDNTLASAEGHAPVPSNVVNRSS